MVDWLDDDANEFDEEAQLAAAKKAAAVLQEACEGLCPGGMPTDLQSRLHMLFGGAVQVAALTCSWAREAEKGGAPKEVVVETANKALNSLTQAASCIAMAFIEESGVDSPPQFSDN